MWLFCLLDPGQIRYRANYTPQIDIVQFIPPKSNSWLRLWRTGASQLLFVSRSMIFAVLQPIRQHFTPLRNAKSSHLTARGLSTFASHRDISERNFSRSVSFGRQRCRLAGTMCVRMRMCVNVAYSHDGQHGTALRASGRWKRQTYSTRMHGWKTRQVAMRY